MQLGVLAPCVRKCEGPVICLCSYMSTSTLIGILSQPQKNLNFDSGGIVMHLPKYTIVQGEESSTKIARLYASPSVYLI